ncbi:MAG: universal stress protein [bacterium]
MSRAEARPVIVVGVDGSEDSTQALRWAAHHAKLTGAEVRAVTGWDIPFTLMVSPTLDESDYEADAEQALRRAIDDVLGPNPDVPVISRVIQGRPARTLVAEAENADLLVIGRHGHGELPGVHLGTVASYCVHHAPCAVVVVRRDTPHI